MSDSRSARMRGKTAVRLRTAGLVIALLSAAGVASLLPAGLQEVDFPHEAHAGLFPVCTGCHANVPDGPAPAYPDADLCARCHDGATLPSVSWSGPSPEPTNVTFDHAAHAEDLARAGDPALTCESCHSEGAGPRMRVVDRAETGTCFSCHAHLADDHLTQATCDVCHVPLASTAFDVTRIRALPLPDDHRTGDFPGGHGDAAARETARCATCHTAERCLACHVDVDNPHIGRVPAAPAELELPPAVAAYPVPATHADPAWWSLHGASASAGACGTCHTSTDCVACHVEPAPEAVVALPSAESVAAPGVRLRRDAPASHEGAFFMEAHGTLAAADERSCVTCHESTSCTECHDAPAGASHHPPDFVASHPAVAFGRADECASCHETTVFCRSCHVESGLGSSGRLGAGYHDAEPVWLLRHGQAARQNLESCVSCHRQTDCVQCHGVLGSFKVSPHGPSFDAVAAWGRSPRSCLACHVGNPLGGPG